MAHNLSFGQVTPFTLKRAFQLNTILLSKAADLDWLFETALAPYAGKISRPVVAQLYGNEDSPEKVEFFAKDDYREKPYAVFELASDGALRETSDLVQFGIARAYFAGAWSDQQDENPDGVNLSGVEIFDVLPEEVAPDALRAALEMATALCQCNGVGTLAALYERAVSMPPQRKADRKLGPELFGHYLGMQGMGQGVGLESFGLDSVDGGIVRANEVLKNVASTSVLAVPYLESIAL